VVSWNEQFRIEGLLSSNFNDLAARTASIPFPRIGLYTNYPNSIDGALKVFAESKSREGARKVIVLITDSDRDPTQSISRYPGPGYAVYAIVIGDGKNNATFQMLRELANRQNGSVINATDPKNVGRELERIAIKTIPGELKSVNLVDTLPSYLGANIRFSANPADRVIRNNDSLDWRTTRLEWKIGDLKNCWTTQFSAPFCWKVPADAQQRSPAAISEISYSNVTSGKQERVQIPEGEIDLKSIEKKTPTSERPYRQPGFEVALSFVGLAAAVLFLRKK